MGYWDNGAMGLWGHYSVRWMSTNPRTQVRAVDEVDATVAEGACPGGKSGGESATRQPRALQTLSGLRGVSMGGAEATRPHPPHGPKWGRWGHTRAQRSTTTAVTRSQENDDDANAGNYLCLRGAACRGRSFQADYASQGNGNHANKPRQARASLHEEAQ